MARWGTQITASSGSSQTHHTPKAHLHKRRGTTAGRGTPLTYTERQSLCPGSSPSCHRRAYIYIHTHTLTCVVYVCVDLPGLTCSASLLAGSEPQRSSGLTPPFRYQIWQPLNKTYNNNFTFWPSRLEKDLENKSIIRMGGKEYRSKTWTRRRGRSTARACRFNTPPSAESTRHRVPAPGCQQGLRGDLCAIHLRTTQETRTRSTQLIVNFSSSVYNSDILILGKSEIKLWFLQSRSSTPPPPLFLGWASLPPQRRWNHVL